MKKTLVVALLSTLSLCLPSAFADRGYGQKTKVLVPEISFPGGLSIPVTQTCLEDGHVRAKRFYQTRNDSLVRPIIQIVKYDLGFERLFTLVKRVETRNHLVQTFDMSTPQGRLIGQNFFNIPNCSEKIISKQTELFVEKTPSAQEMMILTALFQRGITHAEHQNDLIQKPYLGHLQNSYHDRTLSLPRKVEVSLYSHQCRDGLIELTPEFLKYLETPYGQKNYPLVGNTSLSYSDYFEKFYNRIWNNHLRNRSLTQVIGGEGSGSGRVGFGVALGGEGSGSGRRRREDLSTNALALERGGELQITVHMDSFQFFGLSYSLNMLQRIFHLNKEYQPYLNEGAPIPSKLISVECRR